MTHFAHITNGKVDKIIVIEQEMLNTGLWGDPSEWKECTRVHEKGLGKIAYLDSTFDEQDKRFIEPKPFNSWVLNADKEWEAPIKQKIGEENAFWNEEKGTWEEKTKPTKTIEEVIPNVIN